MKLNRLMVIKIVRMTFMTGLMPLMCPDFGRTKSLWRLAPADAAPRADKKRDNTAITGMNFWTGSRAPRGWAAAATAASHSDLPRQPDAGELPAGAGREEVAVAGARVPGGRGA